MIFEENWLVEATNLMKLGELLDSYIVRIDVQKLPFKVSLLKSRHSETAWHVYICAHMTDTKDGDPINVIGSVLITDNIKINFQTFLEKVRKVLQGFMLHELDECFMVDGCLPYDPHFIDRFLQDQKKKKFEEEFWADPCWQE